MQAMTRKIATFLGSDKCSFFLSGLWSEIDALNLRLRTPVQTLSRPRKLPTLR